MTLYLALNRQGNNDKDKSTNAQQWACYYGRLTNKSSSFYSLSSFVPAEGILFGFSSYLHLRQLYWAAVTGLKGQ